MLLNTWNPHTCSDRSFLKTKPQACLRNRTCEFLWSWFLSHDGLWKKEKKVYEKGSKNRQFPVADTFALRSHQSTALLLNKRQHVYRSCAERFLSVLQFLDYFEFLCMCYKNNNCYAKETIPCVQTKYSVITHTHAHQIWMVEHVWKTPNGFLVNSLEKWFLSTKRFFFFLRKWMRNQLSCLFQVPSQYLWMHSCHSWVKLLSHSETFV